MSLLDTIKRASSLIRAVSSVWLEAAIVFFERKQARGKNKISIRVKDLGLQEVEGSAIHEC